MFRKKSIRHLGATLLIGTSFGYLSFFEGVSHIENYNIFLWILVFLALLVAFSLFWELRKETSSLKSKDTIKLFPRINKNPGVKNLAFFIVGFTLILFATLYLFFLMGNQEVGRYGVFGFTAIGTYGLGFLVRIFI